MGNGTPYDTSSRLTYRDHAPLRERLVLPRGVELVIPNEDDRAASPPDGYFTSYLSPFEYGLDFPFPQLVIDVLWALCLPPAQLVPSAWGIFKTMLELWARYELGEPTAEEFFYLFRPRPAQGRLFGWVTFAQVPGRPQLITVTSRKEGRWRENFFFLSSRAPCIHPVMAERWRYDPNFDEFEYALPDLYHTERVFSLIGHTRPSTGPAYRYRVRAPTHRAPQARDDYPLWSAEELAEPNHAFLVWLFKTPCPQKTAIEYGIIRRNERGNIEVCHPGWINAYDRFLHMFDAIPGSSFPPLARSPETPTPTWPESSADTEPDDQHQEPEFVDLVSSSDDRTPSHHSPLSRHESLPLSPEKGDLKTREESPRSEGAFYSNNSVDAYLFSTPVPSLLREIPAPESSEPPYFRALHYGCSLDNTGSLEASSFDWLDMSAQLLGEVAAINNQLAASSRARKENALRLSGKCDALEAEIQKIRRRSVISEAKTTVLNAEIRELKEDIAHHYELSSEERECSEGVEHMSESAKRLKDNLFQRTVEAEARAEQWSQRDLHQERSRRLGLARGKMKKALGLDDVEHLF